MGDGTQEDPLGNANAAAGDRKKLLLAGFLVRSGIPELHRPVLSKAKEREMCYDASF